MDGNLDKLRDMLDQLLDYDSVKISLILNAVIDELEDLHNSIRQGYVVKK